MDLETQIFNLETVPCILIVERGPNDLKTVLINSGTFAYSA